MHIGYVTTYGWWKDEDITPEKARKIFKKFEKVVKDKGFELLFWAGSYGVPEPAMFTVKVKDTKDWEQAGMEYFQANPLIKTRTIFGWDYSE